MFDIPDFVFDLRVVGDECRNFGGDTRETGFFPTITRFATQMQPLDMYNTARVAAAEGGDETPAPAQGQSRRRSSRSKFRADDTAAPEVMTDEGDAMSGTPVGTSAQSGN